MSELEQLLEQARQAEPDPLSEQENDALVAAALRSALEANQSKVERVVERAREAEPAPLSELETRRMTQHAAMTGAARHRSWTRRRSMAVMGFAAALAAAVVMLLIVPRDPVDERGAVAASGATQLELTSGDRLVAAAGARFHVELAEASERRVRLEHGAMLFDVRPIERGHFTVTTPSADILVLGTVFSVNAERGTTVRVYEGRVEVRGQHRVRVVNAGGVVHFGEGDAAVDVLQSEGEEAARLRVSNLDRERAPEAAAEERSARASEPSQESREVLTVQVDERASARAEVQASATSREPPTSVAAREYPRVEDVRNWIATGAAERALAEAERAIRSGEVDPWRMIEGDALRALGRPLDAALAYRRAASELASPRRQQAGFLEARLRANELSDPEAALEALRDAGVTGASSPLRERGLSLEVQLLARLGRDSEIIPVAETYLRDYPDGPQVEVMRAHLAER
jgi:ferric-dicitrate binding protein FerR (iron transport regulator)